MASCIKIMEQSIVDLTTVPLEDLKAELNRRKIIAQEARKKARDEKVCCKNCVYRIQGRTNNGLLQTYDSWVCYRRPKKFRNYLEHAPKYNQAYFACNNRIKECSMFVHKKSPKGLKIRDRLFLMEDRMS